MKARMMMLAAALRTIDGAVRLLQRARKRLDPPPDAEGSPHGGRKPDPTTTGDTGQVTAVPRSRGLLYRTLVLLACLLLGGGIGALITYRGLSKLHEGRELTIERLKDEVAQSKIDETRSLKIESRLQNAIADLRKQLREASQETADYKSQMEELNNQLLAAQRVERPLKRNARARGPAGSGAAAANRAGTCDAASGNAAADLTNCIKKFNNQ